MTNVDDIVIGMKRNPKNVRFVDLCKVCETYFGKPPNRGGSHKIYKTLRQGDPRINIQNNSGKFMVRIPPDVHRKLAVQAAESGVSLNRIASSKLSQ